MVPVAERRFSLFSSFFCGSQSESALAVLRGTPSGNFTSGSKLTRRNKCSATHYQRADQHKSKQKTIPLINIKRIFAHPHVYTQRAGEIALLQTRKTRTISLDRWHLTVNAHIRACPATHEVNYAFALDAAESEPLFVSQTRGRSRVRRTPAAASILEQNRIRGFLELLGNCRNGNGPSKPLKRVGNARHATPALNGFSCHAVAIPLKWCDLRSHSSASL